jgi:Protein of unknown function (DUF2721)
MHNKSQLKTHGCSHLSQFLITNSRSNFRYQTKEFKNLLIGSLIEISLPKQQGSLHVFNVRVYPHDTRFDDMDPSAQSSNIGLEVLTAMITPAILISACAALILSTSQRLGRIMERVRQLSDIFSSWIEEYDNPLHNIDFLQHHLQIYVNRARFLQSALMSLYLALAMLVATSLAIGIVATTHQNITWLPVSLALLGAVILLFSTLILLMEGHLAIKSTDEELQAIHISIQTQSRDYKNRVA